MHKPHCVAIVDFVAGFASMATRTDAATSKAFTSEETPDEPIVVPPRAPLPDGVPNYVTARGLARLREELALLEAERARVADTALDDAEHDRRRKVDAARLADLAHRIASAVLVDPQRQPQDEVRFGATVTVRDDEGATTRYRIVGVDEADPATGTIAFLSPLARALTGLAVGDTTQLRTAGGERELTVDAISYDEDGAPPK
jgi:transcription elongation factor GreB